MKKIARKIIACDFDGCLCVDCAPEIGSPNWEAINKLKDEQARGTAIILWTCRRGKNLQRAISACAEWGLEFDAINEDIPEVIRIRGECSRKIIADEYWDDHAVSVIYKE